MEDKPDNREEILEAVRENAEIVRQIATLSSEEMDVLQRMAQGKLGLDGKTERDKPPSVNFPFDSKLMSMLEDYAGRKGLTPAEALRRVLKGLSAG
ncbi:MAG: hypothetical protein HOC74_34450 [Gemmatimonadetes bacterium]|jgi:hypothetical protein|nr:hypothetical protein [Gemmatimonadota bacterium]